MKEKKMDNPRIQSYHDIRRISKPLVLLFAIVFLAGIGISELQAQEAAMIKTGRFWTVVMDHGGLGAASMSAGWWPNDFNVVGNSSGSGSASSGDNIYIATSNWNGIAKAICAPVSELNPSGTIVTPLVSYVRHAMPDNLVNNVDVKELSLGVEDPTKMVGTADQVVENMYKYAIGVEASRRVYAWSQENHNDYIVNDITFENVSDQTLTDVVFSMCIGRNDFGYAYGNNPSPSGLHGTSWHWHHYYGGRPGDSLRVWYWYHADDPTTNGDNMGLPAFGQEGRLILPHFQFYGFLHVSQAPYTNDANDLDDPLQPKITFISEGQVNSMPSENARMGSPIDNPPWHDNAKGTLSEQIPMEGAYPNTWHMKNSDEVGDPDFQVIGTNITYNGWHAYDYSGIGPYAEFKPGEKVHIIYVVGATGLSHKMGKQVGKELVDEIIQPPPNLPDADKGYFPSNFVFPVGADQLDINKDLWLSTGVDSVMTVMSKAKWNYEHNWNVPQAPPPPNQSVSGFPDYAEVKWSSPEAEALPNFAGYKIMRRISALDTAFFQVVHTTSPDDKAAEHTWQDTEVKFGASYYYYVQSSVTVAEDDMNAYPNIRGKQIWSGRTYQATPQSVEPPRAAAPDISDVYIAPNPYNINDPRVQAMGWTDFRGLIFFNLPSKCTVKIFTENGDLVKTIEHDSPVNAGSITWDMLTESQQVIASGMYIATIEDGNGGVAIRKFLVAR